LRVRLSSPPSASRALLGSTHRALDLAGPGRRGLQPGVTADPWDASDHVLGRCDDEVSQGADPRHADVASTKHLGLVVLAFGMLQYVAAFAIWRGAS
jgi:hypothetical protein